MYSEVTSAPSRAFLSLAVLMNLILIIMMFITSTLAYLSIACCRLIPGERCHVRLVFGLQLACNHDIVFVASTTGFSVDRVLCCNYHLISAR